MKRQVDRRRTLRKSQVVCLRGQGEGKREKKKREEEKRESKKRHFNEKCWDVAEIIAGHCFNSGNN